MESTDSVPTENFEKYFGELLHVTIVHWYPKLSLRASKSQVSYTGGRTLYSLGNKVINYRKTELGFVYISFVFMAWRRMWSVEETEVTMIFRRTQVLTRNDNHVTFRPSSVLKDKWVEYYSKLPVQVYRILILSEFLVRVQWNGFL